ncbi:DUF7010 family protein [Rugamonas rivuli]|uniref:DUF308 domain-containing protein n=1 Tax=Rugamonas rivuli TaxID=2743358 RepID=A0A843SBP6_9BURK|nr:hypothetical protein [Rugamonas rivuli]MQA19524.1 hypothetical protein [Rugamonas rivuli]
MNLSLTEEQQNEMRHAYYDGAPGIFVSGLVWVAATFVCYLAGMKQAVWTLLIGGALIYPLSAVLTKVMGRPAKTGKDNALNQLVMASTFWLILCCAMAFGLFLLRPAFFFPAMMVTIGSRYLVFASVYGRSIFWVMGGSLIVAGVVAFFSALSPGVAAGIGGLIEVLFAVFVFLKASKPAV